MSEVVQTLTATPNQWDIVEDALSSMVAEYRRDADMWKGRSRESVYLRLAFETEAVLVTLSEQRR